MYLHRFQKYLILASVFLFPIFFLPITQEYFMLQKTYMLLLVTIVSLIVLSIQFLYEQKIYLPRSPVIYLVYALLIALGTTILISSANKIQALYSLPTGLLVFTVLAMYSTLIILASAYLRKDLPLMQFMTWGGIGAALLASLLETVTLRTPFTFLKSSQFSTIGSPLDALIFFGFLLVVLVFTLPQKGVLLQRLTLIGIVSLATVLVALSIFKQPRATLPPWHESWLASAESLKEPRTAFFGVGIDMYGSLFARVKSISYNTSPHWETNFQYARSSLLHMLAEGGLITFTIILAIMFFVARDIHGLFLQRDGQALMFASAGTYLLAIWILFPPTLTTFSISMIFIAALVQKSMHGEFAHVIKMDLRSIPFGAAFAAFVSIACAVVFAYVPGKVYIAEVYFKKSIDALRMNDGQETYTNVQKAIKFYPQSEKFRAQNSQINLLLANNLARKKSLTSEDRRMITQFVQQAIAEAKALVSLNPHQASNWNQLAVVYRNIAGLAQGADAWSIAAYSKAIERDPYNPLLRLNLGTVYYSLQKFDTAAIHFKEAITLKPDWINAHYNYAWALYKGGKTHEAQTAIKKVLSLADKKSSSYTIAQSTLEVFATDKASEVQIRVDPQGALGLPATSSGTLNPPLQLQQESGL